MPDVAIELQDCWYSYDGRTPALRGVSCSIALGAWAAIIGQNGSGKTTLAKLCNGLLRPQKGRVRILGDDAEGRPVGEMARQVGYLFQNPDHQIFAPTVREEVAFGLDNLGLPHSEAERRAEEALTLFGLESYADRPPAMLGYGLRRQVTVASVFALRPSILILDEPTSGLDRGSTHLLLERLHRLRRAGHTILLITHDVRLVCEHAEWVILLQQGQLVAEGATRQIFSRPELLAQVSAAPPPVTQLSQALRSWGMKGDSLTVEAFYDEYATLLAGRSEDRR